MKGIYRFEQSCGRMGDLSGIFIADVGETDKINGQTVCFGEVLGKHSEIEVTIVVGENMKLVSFDPSEVEMFERLELATGINPHEYWEE